MRLLRTPVARRSSSGGPEPVQPPLRFDSWGAVRGRGGERCCRCRCRPSGVMVVSRRRSAPARAEGGGMCVLDVCVIVKGGKGGQRLRRACGLIGQEKLCG